MCACVRACVCACVRVCVCACMHVMLVVSCDKNQRNDNRARLLAGAQMIIIELFICQVLRGNTGLVSLPSYRLCVWGLSFVFLFFFRMN